MMRMLDLFCGRFGWGRAFAERGWDVIGVDLVEPPEIPQGCIFIKADILEMSFQRGRLELNPILKDYGYQNLGVFDFICSSSPCEQFSVHGMKHFHPNPPYPELGIRLFNHTRSLCEASGVPYVMENVRAAQQFVGNAVNHCGPFYLWGTGVPPLMNQGIRKGYSFHIRGVENMTIEERRAARKHIPTQQFRSGSPERLEMTAQAATIPPELASCVADYAERLLEMRQTA